MADHPEIKFGAGCHIAAAAKMLVDAVAKTGEPVQGKFNDILLIADASSTPDGIVAFFDQQREIRAEEYRNSPEGKRAEQEAEERRSRLQQTHDSLMRKLPSLDMHDQVAVLDWLCQMQEPSDHIGIILRRTTIVSAFEKAGFVANANTGKAYKADDRENNFRYLVGQALAGLKDGPAIHSILHKFTKEWREKFLVNA
jgi:hypothetical protein